MPFLAMRHGETRHAPRVHDTHSPISARAHGAPLCKALQMTQPASMQHPDLKTPPRKRNHSQKSTLRKGAGTKLR